MYMFTVMDIVAALGLKSCLIVTLFADVYAPFANFRQVDPSGQFYLVVKASGDKGSHSDGNAPIAFELVRRAGQSLPVPAATDEWGASKSSPNPKALVRVGDEIIGSGELKYCPRLIIISTEGNGFVGMDVRGDNRELLDKYDAVVLVRANGEIRHTVKLQKLFTEKELAQYKRSIGSIWWLGGGWIDDHRSEVIVVGGGRRHDGGPAERLFKCIDIRSGQIRDTDSECILVALRDRNPSAMELCLELVSELRLSRALVSARQILEDQSLSASCRLRAAVALGRLNDYSGAEFISSMAMNQDTTQEYAILNVPVVVKGHSAKLLCNIVRKYGKNVSLHAWQAMSNVPAKEAIPELVKLLDERHSVAASRFAIECIGDKRTATPDAIRSLIGVLQGQCENEGKLLDTHEMAAIALGKIGPRAAEAVRYLEECAIRRERMQSDQKARHEMMSENEFRRAIRRIKTD